MDSDLNGIYLIFNSVMNWLKTLPWSTVIVGIVVPIASAYISYTLAENSSRRKENNRLNVYIEFVNAICQYSCRNSSFLMYPILSPGETLPLPF